MTAQYLADTHPDERVFLVGSPRLETILEEAAIELTTAPDAADVVLGSFDREFSYSDLTDALQALEDGSAFYGTDPDTTIPVDGGTIPGSGAILAAMERPRDANPMPSSGNPPRSPPRQRTRDSRPHPNERSSSATGSIPTLHSASRLAWRRLSSSRA